MLSFASWIGWTTTFGAACAGALMHASMATAVDRRNSMIPPMSPSATYSPRCCGWYQVRSHRAVMAVTGALVRVVGYAVGNNGRSHSMGRIFGPFMPSVGGRMLCYPLMNAIVLTVCHTPANQFGGGNGDILNRNA